MLRHTPAEHPDYEKLSIVLPKMEEVANWINNEKSKFDNLTIIQTLSDTISGYEDVSCQSCCFMIFRLSIYLCELTTGEHFTPQSFLKLGRRFLREGLLSQYISDSMRSKQRYLFLFSDIILLTQPRRGSAMPLLKKAAPKYVVALPFLYGLSLRWPRVSSPGRVSCVMGPH